MGNIFLIHNDGQLVEMAEKQYDSETLLQELLAKHPNLLAGDQINSDVPRKWLLVGREVALSSEENGAGRWSVDHLFLDQDSVPTIVEVKRSSDTRIRREVVGQMLDYAANAVVYWPMDKIRTQFRARYDTDEQAGQAIADLLDNPEPPIEEFWQKAEKNLRDGTVRLLFVSDRIPTELQRIIEFLNEQMNRTQVLGVEIKQFTGQGLSTLVPRVIGETVTARDTKSPREEKQWDEASFMQALAADPKGGPDAAAVVEKILEWAVSAVVQVKWGTGRKDGGFYLSANYKGLRHWLISVWSYGRLNIELQRMQVNAPFNDSSKRLELLHRLNRIPGLSILANENIAGYPGVSLSLLKDAAGLKQFLDTFDWAIGEFKASVDSKQAQ